MRFFLKGKSKQAGLAPGTLVYTGRQRPTPPRIHVIDYDAEHVTERDDVPLDEALAYRDSEAKSWINVSVLHDVELVRRACDHFGVHPLVQEDVLNTQHRPKAEAHEGFVFVTLKMLTYDEAARAVQVEQVSLAFGKGFVLSFQEAEGDVFEPVRKRLRGQRGRIHKLGADYLAYALVDCVVDHYFAVLERVGDDIDRLEAEVTSQPDEGSLREIHRLKQEMLVLRQAAWPLREVVGTLERSETPQIQRTTHVFLRDVYDHIVQVIDTVETYREMLSGLLDVYLSSVSNRMNDIMKVLTLIATVFIPLTFIAGVYGMNFNPAAGRWSMPELNWEWGYATVWVVMLAVAIALIVFFKRKRWL